MPSPSTARRQKTVREAIHGDIRLEPHELDVINTRVFQRLHGIKQLGMAYLVYPTATHTRFEHSLGCVHVAQKIIDQLRSLGKGITARDQLGYAANDAEFPISVDLRHGIRMAALLHDLAHVPYGHTLEDELGTLREHHDSTEQRVTRFFGYLKEEIQSDKTKDSRRLIPLIEYALKTMRTISHIDRAIRRGERSDATDMLLADDEWFVADIIGNTICADLLDYARRDMRATGLNQEYDDRLFSYFDLAPDDDGRIRLALRTIKPQGLRLDAVSEVLNVLRIRYTLSERVIFHHTKNIASAMLGEALSYLHFEAQAFDQMRDEQVLPWIHTQASEQGLPPEHYSAVERLLQGLESRRLHKAVFRVGPTQETSYEVGHASHLGTDFADAQRRRDLQDKIRSQIPQLRPGDIILYCPVPQMTMKEVWANVRARNDHICRPLRQEAAPHLPRVVLNEIKALEEKYTALWSWTLVLAPDMLNYAFAVQALIQQELGVANDPFLQTYLEGQDELRPGREIMKRAPGEYAVQAKGVEIALAKPEEMERAAASGPPAEDDYWHEVVRRARDALYPPPVEAP
jgi:HD superfamily phosphohydrolase